MKTVLKLQTVFQNSNFSKFFLLFIYCFFIAKITPFAQNADLILHNAKVYTVDEQFSIMKAIAIKDGDILAIGTDEEILTQYQAPRQINAEGKSIYPGFYDAHCHFYRYGLGLQTVELVGTTSYEEIIEKLTQYQKNNPMKTWIIGRGWDQNDWESQAFPTKDRLDELFPNTPVFLTRIDGHAALVNQKALDLASIEIGTNIEGGAIVKESGKVTGVLIDNAIGLVSSKIPAPTLEEQKEALLLAQEKCFAVGLTTLADAGLDKQTVELIDKMQQNRDLKIRLYAMLSAYSQNINAYLNKGIYKTDRLHVRSFKIYADGALGSRGACLITPYSDKPNETGFLRSSPEELKSTIQKIGEAGFQVNTHCIGDSANRLILDIYGEYLQGQNDRRWRIEHAQVVQPEDMLKFRKFSVIPSVQPTHCTSDMYWADERLGDERVQFAYAYKELLDQYGQLALGSDFPVEDINPLYGFYAATARMDFSNYPEGGFQMENAISREDALRGMTIWAAYSNFEEGERGSLEIGKMADLVILEEDIMEIPPHQTWQVKVWKTIVGGEIVFEKD